MKNKSFIWISFIVLIFGIYAIPKIIKRIKDNDIVVNDRLSNKKKNSGLQMIGKVPDFKLVDQNNQTIDNQAMKGKVYVVEFFFSTCPTICPKMNKNMLTIEQKFLSEPNFGIVSISINPENDTSEVLKKHAELLGVSSKNWHFLTGNQDYILNLSTKGFNLYANKNPNIAGGFEHSGLFALVDKNGSIRCRKDNFGNPIVYYDGLDPKGVSMLINDIELLLNE